MKHALSPLALLLSLGLGLAACGVPADDGSDGGSDGGDPRVLCSELTAPLTNIALDEGGLLTQIHVAVGFAAEQVFVTYSAPVPAGGNFSIKALRVACDGTIPQTPWTVSDDESINQLDSVVTGDSDRALIAWQSDNGTAPYNLDTHYRLYDDEGVATTAPIELAAQRGGVVNVHNAWMPAATPRSGGGFTLVGAWGHADATAFQAYGQHLDASGALVGESWDWDLEPTMGQISPTASLDDAGTLHVAWHAEDAASSEVVESTLDAGASLPGAATAVAGSSSGGSPSLASGGSDTWLAFMGANGPVIRLPGGNLVTPGQAGTDHSPVIAADAGGALVAWYRNQGGLANAVHYLHVATDGTMSGAGEVGTTDAAPYPLALTSLGGGRFFLAWQDGPNPDFAIRGRFVSRP